MSYFSDHLKDVLTKRGITAYGLGKLTGLNKQYCYKLIDGIRTPEDDTLEKIAASYELALPLPTLKGWRAIDSRPEVIKAYIDEPSNLQSFADLFHLLKGAIGREPTLQEVADIIGAAPIAIEPMYMEYVNKALGKKVVHGEAHLKSSKTPPVKTVLLPIFGATVPAGFPNSGDEWINGYFELPESMIAHPKDSFIIQTRGDSMLQAGILDGDSLIVDRAVEPKDKDIVVACLDGEFTVKRLRKKRGKIYLEPANDAYEAIDATGRIDCCYKVVGSYRQF